MAIIDPAFKNTDRLNRAINFAHANIHKGIQLDQLAEAACLSKFHFSRLFHDHVGESPITFLKRTRLERAAALLRSEAALPIKQIAYQCGFASGPLFSRNVRQWSGRTPGEIRVDYLNRLEENAGTCQAPFEIPAPLGLARDIDQAAKQVDIVRLGPTPVAYVRSFGRYGDCRSIDQAFARIEDWASSENPPAEETGMIGISWDFPALTPNGRCRFDACLPLPPGYDRPCGLSRQTIPGGLYATARLAFREVEDLTLIWKWFIWTLNRAPKFRQYTVRHSIGPWFEKLRFATCQDSAVTLYAPLDLKARH